MQAPAFYVLQTGFTPATPSGKVLKVDVATGARALFATYLGAENYDGEARHGHGTQGHGPSGAAH